MIDFDRKPKIDFSLILAISRTYGGLYLGDHLQPSGAIELPKDTWLQRRRAALRESESGQ